MKCPASRRAFLFERARLSNWIIVRCNIGNAARYPAIYIAMQHGVKSCSCDFPLPARDLFAK
jgi:hypothetical protein